MNRQLDSFFASLYSNIAAIADGKLGDELAARISSATEETDIHAVSEDSIADTLILLAGYQRDRMPTALASFFEVPPVKDRVESAITRLRTDHPGLLENKALGDFSEKLYADDDNDADEENESDDEDDGEDNLGLNLGFESLWVISTILLSTNSKAHPAIHFCMRDSQNALLLDRTMPVTDGLFLSSAILDACVESVESYVSTVADKSKWPSSIREASAEYAGDLSKMIDRLRSLSVRLSK